MSAYGYDEDGEREHDCCDRCGSGSCPGSGSRGQDACTATFGGRSYDIPRCEHGCCPKAVCDFTQDCGDHKRVAS